MLGYYWVDFMFVAINVFGIGLHITLYIVDIKYHDAILDRVDAGESLAELISSPAPGKTAGEYIRESMGATRESQKLALVNYKMNSAARESLRRSLATNRPT